MPELLKLIPVDKARRIWLDALPSQTVRPEKVKTVEANGRYLAEDITAPHPLPAFSRSAMDGYAVRATDTAGASENQPVALDVVGEILMGRQTGIVLGPCQAALIHTGGMLPANCDAVVMIEFTQADQNGKIKIFRPVMPLENIIALGEDVQTGQVVISKGTRIESAEIGGLMAFGITEIRVARKPRIAILSCGDEVIPVEATPKLGEVRDINSHTLAARVEEWGGEPVHYGIAPDIEEVVEKTFLRSLDECDAVLITAGSSASVRDLTAQVIHRGGHPGVLVHGINMRPGKPTILAICDGKPVIGLPGNPISALVISWLFLNDLLSRLQGNTKPVIRSYINARLSKDTPSVAGREDWVPVKISNEGGGFTAEPIFFKSNLIFNLVSADGLMHIPPQTSALKVNEIVQVFFL
jgi:molybdopterin molybdotransferase